MKHTQKPELLAPGGNSEKLKIALLYGADAVYVGIREFGLRKSAENLTFNQLQDAVDLANNQGKKIYVVLNSFAHHEDLETMPRHLEKLQKIQPHAFIISDAGVLELVKKHTTIPLHASTQASITNAYAAKFWKHLGASRIIVARELSIAECKTIQDEADIEVETFIHGAMCASYSGKCVISNYTAGRDSNRGGCIQSCRHTYEIIPDHPQEKTELKGQTYVMNAKDLCGIKTLPQVIEAGLASLKIEGRMKSNMYAANAASVYREAIDACFEAYQAGKTVPETQFQDWKARLEKVSNRDFTSGFLEGEPEAADVNYEFGAYEKSVEYIGTVKDKSPEGDLFIEVRVAVEPGQRVEFMRPNQSVFEMVLPECWDLEDQPVTRSKPNSIIRVPAPAADVPVYSILRMPLGEENHQHQHPKQTQIGLHK